MYDRPGPFSQQTRDVPQQTPADAVNRDMDLDALCGGPDAVLPARNLRRKNRGPWQDPGEFRHASFASDQSDDLYAPLRQNLADEAPDSGSCASEQRDDPGTRVRGKGVVCRADD